MTVGQSPTCSFSVSNGREVLFLLPFRAVLGAIHVQVTDRPSPNAPSLTQKIIVQMVYTHSSLTIVFAFASCHPCNRRGTWVEEYYVLYNYKECVEKRLHTRRSSRQKRCNSGHGNETEKRASSVRTGKYILEGQREQVKVTGSYNRCSCKWWHLGSHK